MDDPVDYPTEPFGPVSQQARDRRLIMRFYELWSALADGKPYPALTDFSSKDLALFKPFSVLIDLQDGYNSPIIRVIGKDIAGMMDDDYTGRIPADTPRQSILSRVTDHYLEVLANRAPVAVEAEYRDQSGQEIPYRTVLAPLSRDGDSIDFILGVINWKGASMEEPRAVTVDLKGDLAALCAQVTAAGRSRQALYQLLSDILGFWRGAESSPDDYAAILGQNGLKAQKRAPFTALLKLVFGRRYDKTRLTEYAAALAHAQRQHWNPALFLERLSEDGGMKAVVRAERRQRGKGAASARPDLQDSLLTLPIIARIKDWPATNASDEAFVLLARRENNGDLAIVATDAVDGPQSMQTARRMLRRQIEKNK